MHSRRIAFLIAALCLLLLLTSAVQAASSNHFRIDWLVPLSGGGGAASSAGYELKVTVGQTGIFRSTSTGYAASLGFWSLMAQDFPVFMPVIKR